MHNSPEAWSFDPWSMSYPVLVMVVMSPSNILTSCDMKIVTYFMSANLIILDNELCCNPGTRCIILASSGTSWMSFAVCMVFAFDEMVYGRFWLTVALCRGMGLMFCHSFVQVLSLLLWREFSCLYALFQFLNGLFMFVLLVCCCYCIDVICVFNLCGEWCPMLLFSVINFSYFILYCVLMVCFYLLPHYSPVVPACFPLFSIHSIYHRVLFSLFASRQKQFWLLHVPFSLQCEYHHLLLLWVYLFVQPFAFSFCFPLVIAFMSS